MSTKHLSRTPCRLLALVTGLLMSVSPLSFAADITQPALLAEKVEWSADGNSTMSIDNGIRILNVNDNVKITQGSLEILGDTAILEYDEPTRELIRVTVHGTPVQYSQNLETAGGSVRGNSDSIVMFTQEDTGDTVVELTGNAHISSPDTTLNCVAIVYLPRLDLVPNTTGPCVGSFNQE